MDHDALVAAAQPVAYFGDVQLFSGPRTTKGLSVYWHERNRQWLVDIPGFAGGPARAEVLRKFAEGALAQLRSGSGEFESTVCSDEYTSIEVSVGFDDDAYLIVWVWFDSKRDFKGVSKFGEALYGSQLGMSYLELYVEPADRHTLIATLQALLTRLGTAGESRYTPPQPPTVVTTFTKRTSDPKKTRLDIARRPSDNQWLVTLYPALTRPAKPEAIRALAETARTVIRTRESRSATLLAEAGYQLDVTIGPEADAFHVTVTVHSPAEGGTKYTLDLDGKFAPVSEAQLTDMATSLSAACSVVGMEIGITSS